MKRNCNLELQPSHFLHLHDEQHSCHMAEKDEGHKQKQQLTIFYKGKIAVCDATELQARAIIWLASRESESESESESEPSELPASPLRSPTSGSLKRSLMRFLQTRKKRVQATSPYPLTRRA